MHIPPDWGIFFVLIVSFLVFWFIFSRLFFHPFLNLLSERENRFRGMSERTEQLLKQARANDLEREQRLAQIRTEALANRESERRKVEAETAQMMETARAEARAQIESVRERIESELRAAEDELGRMARTLAGQLAERVLGRPLGGAGSDN
jgi:F0F1-type ATP synthase membrane subunit b/b'